MKKGFSFFWLFLLVVAIGWGAYYYGMQSGIRMVENFATNNVLIQQIAELSTLEVHGNSSIKSSNIDDDNNLADTFRKFFLERTLQVSIPYIAKFGIEMGDKKISIEEKNRRIYIVLPAPKLLSFEVRLDQAKMVSKKGILESIDDQAYDRVIQKLYAQSKSKLEQNQTYKEQAKGKIRKVIEDYYSPLGYNVDIVFADELKSKVLETKVE